MIFPAKNAAEYKKRVDKFKIHETADAIFVHCCRIKALSPVSEIAEEFPVILTLLCGFADYAEKLSDFNVLHDGILCNEKILDIRVPAGTSSTIDPLAVKVIAEGFGIQIKIGEL